MMGNNIRNSIHSFWKGKLKQAEAKDLLDKVENQQSDLQRQLKSEFGEQQEDQELLSSDQSYKLLQTIRSRAGIHGHVRKIYPYKWIAAAAVLVILGTFGTYFTLQNSNDYTTDAIHTLIASNKIYTVSSSYDTVRYVLCDGSTIVLSPHSTIRYDNEYGSANRQIELIGEGKFAVQRDSLLPFEVKANGFTTTALGTEFIVDGRKLANTTVHLLSGNVVIRSTNEARMRIRDTYLTVGEMLHIDETRKIMVREPAVKVKLDTQSEIVDQHISNSLTGQPKNLRFVRSDLTEIIRQVAQKFDTRIILDPAVPRNLTFTGEFSAHDDLATILNTICLVNDLQYINESANQVLIRLKNNIRAPEEETYEIK
ncbi:FecR family protein [Sphingobacterium sp. JB170]|uniref:FecR family protein n=1 Tax=Sphingobacterium sp. JB170 TaxID=1434842 RepID=UPI00097EC6AE|nr:FecR family protein [Sphingobacterium sp. JB170]SJN44575.1 putative anti-sigma factor [Sphingobacterium sp. JB170]